MKNIAITNQPIAYTPRRGDPVRLVSGQTTQRPHTRRVQGGLPHNYVTVQPVILRRKWENGDFSGHPTLTVYLGVRNNFSQYFTYLSNRVPAATLHGLSIDV